MGLYDKAKVEDHLRQVGSTDPIRNKDYHSGAQYQASLDQAELDRRDARIAELEAQLAAKGKRKK